MDMLYLRYVAIYLGLPNLFFLLLGVFFYLTRPLFVVDYVAVCIVSPLLSRRNISLFFGILFVVDFAFSLAPAYHLDGVEFALNACSILLMYWPVGLLSVMVIAASAACYKFFLQGYFLSVSRINLRQLAIVSMLGLFLLGLDMANGSNIYIQSKWHLVNLNIAGGNLHKIALVTRNAFVSNSNEELAKVVEVRGATDLLRSSLGSGRGASNKILLVVVESYGSSISDKLRFRLAEPFERPALKRRYEIRHGEIPFLGSTVPGEIRELCGQRIASPSSLGRVDFANCLPMALRNEGYETIAIHGFSSHMFGRNSWYPQLGFEKIMFAGDIEAEGGVERCGHVFRGICDTHDVFLIKNELAKTGSKRQFIYWLTLNSHLPVAHDTALERDLDCPEMLGVGNDQDVCRLNKIFLGLFENIADIAEKSKDDLRIILVGDHSPPFLALSDRALFKAGVVPFVELIPKVNGGLPSVK